MCKTQPPFCGNSTLFAYPIRSSRASISLLFTDVFSYYKYRVVEHRRDFHLLQNFPIDDYLDSILIFRIHTDTFDNQIVICWLSDLIRKVFDLYRSNFFPSETPEITDRSLQWLLSAIRRIRGGLIIKMFHS